MGGDESDNPWAWTGLLKWSLNYVDGTADNANFTPMSKEDREFLEKVMQDGIVDEGERMKFILEEASKAMEYYRVSSIDEDEEVDAPPIEEEDLVELLQELRDIVEQIDYARAFCSLQGIPFLLGCIQQPAVPVSIRSVSLGIIATIAQNNPSVQHQLLEMGTIKSLCDLFYAQTSGDAFKAKIMQSISSIVRNHDLGEQVFANLPQAPQLFADGLAESSSVSLRSKTLFFLRALVTSDTSDIERIKKFQTNIETVRDSYLLASVDPSLREMTVAFVNQLLQDRKGGVQVLLERKSELVALGIQRISALRALTGDEREYGAVELEHWENAMLLLSRAEPETGNTASDQTLLLKN
eukprot:Nitzschia sp. Nitz4//scaffold29_size155292//23429//24490//NITZ4_002639-RA/size155292-processed-gene-0.6-mRNA-1//1//CDS//3329546391//8124//frame0